MSVTILNQDTTSHELTQVSIGDVVSVMFSDVINPAIKLQTVAADYYTARVVAKLREDLKIGSGHRWLIELEGQVIAEYCFEKLSDFNFPKPPTNYYPPTLAEIIGPPGFIPKKLPLQSEFAVYAV